MSRELREYEVAVVGGGPAGLTTALYATRLGHDTVLIDRGGGRAAMMLDTHNVIGITEDVSGNDLLGRAREQVEGYGADVRQEFVERVERVGGPEDDAPFRLETGDEEYAADRVVLATGFTDARPDPPLPRTGRGLHYCLHCDAYMFVDEPVFSMGHGDSAAYVAMIMLNFTDEVDLLLDGDDPSWSDETDELLRAHPVDIVEEAVTGTFQDEDDPDWLGGLEFADGTTRGYRGGFPMYGSDYNNGLAADLGAETNDDGTVAVDDHGRTSVDGLYAVGDLTPGHNQVPVAMGQGAKAGIAVHKGLRTFPKPLDELDDGVDAADVPAISPDLRAAARTHGDD
ncbi:thioredoxin-disulfide reductase [Halobacteriales archaeon QS_9_68_17]|nr:MAG: thioredoxin-disulfide reductase [Halobacteriales archaeon QS_9_68_17]